MCVSFDNKCSLRCDARFLVGELSDDDASAMKRGAELLRTLAEHVKLEADGTPSAALPLAASPKLVDGGSGQPEPAMRTAAVADGAAPSPDKTRKVPQRHLKFPARRRTSSIRRQTFTNKSKETKP